MRVWRIARPLIQGATLVYLALPIIAIVLFSLATRWTSSILPAGYTLAHWIDAFADPRLAAAFARSTALATAAAVLDAVLVVPAAYWSRVRNPRIRTVLQVSAAIPFALPYLVIAFGILTLYGGNPITAGLNNSLPELVFAHAAICFPFMYWAVDAAMAAAGIERLAEAAETAGATPVQAIRRVIVPNIVPGLVSGAILVFATSFGEFAVVQVLIGGSFETVPLWQADALYSTNPRFDELAASAVATFGLLFALSAIVVAADLRWASRLRRPAGLTAAPPIAADIASGASR
jgi:putative spermidine/putrescine transport system permease protein